MTEIQRTDQQTHWAKTQRSNQFLKTLLDNYFAGKASPELDSMPLKDKHFWIKSRDSYLRLYDLVRYCWHSISADATLNGFENFPSSPGEMIVRVVEFELETENIPDYRKFCLKVCQRDAKRSSWFKRKMKQFFVLEAEITAELRSMATEKARQLEKEK